MQSITLKLQALRSRAAHLALFPIVAAMCHPAMAALPTMPTPGTDMNGQEVASGDWFGSLSAWFKIGLVLFGTVICGIGFIKVAAGGLSKWQAYSAGRAEIGDLKEYIMMAAVLMVFIVAMITYAFRTIGQT